MSNNLLDELKRRSSRQRAGVVSPDTPSSDPVKAAGAKSAQNAQNAAPVSEAVSGAALPAAPEVASYCRYWIEQLQSLHGLPRDAATAAVREAMGKAPPEHQPAVEDARLFVLAGGQELPYREVVSWLKLRTVLTDGQGTLDPEVARHWLRQLGAPQTPPDPTWTARCRRTAAEARQVGKGLSPATVAALEADPEAARGYLRCAGAKARLSEADGRVIAGETQDHRSESARAPGADRMPEAANTAPSGRPEGDPAASTGRPPLVPPTAQSSGIGAFPAAGMGPGAGIGLALGGLVGGLFGGAVAGLKAAVSPAVTRAAPVGSGSTAGSPKGFRDAVAAVRARSREHSARRAVAEAEGALTEFTQSARHLSQHPQLASFWREIDRQAGSRFAGDRAGALREMAGQPLHPLRLLFERLTRADPDVALHHGRAHTAFERLQDAWASCASTHRKLGTEWAPSAEQMRALRAACRQVPPAKDRLVLVEQAERFLRTLVQTIRHAFERPAAPAPGTGP